MECFLHLLTFCVFDPSNVYVRGEINYAMGVEHDFTYIDGGQVWTRHSGEWCATRFCSGPTGTLRLGVTVEVSREITLEYGFQHVSYLNTNRDVGLNTAFFSTTWRPFK